VSASEKNCGVVTAPRKTTTLPRLYVKWFELSDDARAAIKKRWQA
jgi:hypothetical protein